MRRRSAVVGSRGLPGVLGYRPSHFDAMIGHRSPRYLLFGCALPARRPANWGAGALARLRSSLSPLVGGTGQTRSPS